MVIETEPLAFWVLFGDLRAPCAVAPMRAQSWSFAAIFVLALGLAFALALGRGAGTICEHLLEVSFAHVPAVA